ncbi:HisA/HisF-related TIM barrel protein [Roseiconus lacunae]|uniref:HisA/HisF-related TIM barrel protein n=1 Tax=Roseiconus lacunae TaxID=2605694 RepID=A0ABT7PJI1_9BACT|nr:HisA/HisF-related TIM barrel protein [Roseiconus lacunae]MDM4016649.1 HisA/HisF-related TIM barrel protein [Roseiconus lacunae]
MARWDGLVGVIDLKRGQAVHAVAGRRDRYQPTRQFYYPDGNKVSIDGDAALLAQQYCRVGIAAIYVADLDAICGGALQDNTLEEIITAVSRMSSSGVSYRIDAGLGQADDQIKAERLAVLLAGVSNWRVFVATEAAVDTSVLETLTDVLGKSHVGVSLDFAAGQWLSPRTTPRRWIDAINALEIEAVITLDLTSVGSGDPRRTIDLIKRVRGDLPQVQLTSGGGVRAEPDARRLRDAGADEVMVASLFTGDGSPFAASD